MSVAGIAMRNQVNANQLRRWMLLHRVREATASVAAPGAQRLLCVNFVPESPASGVAIMMKSDGAIEIELGGAVVRVREGANAQTLRTVLEVLRESAG